MQTIQHALGIPEIAEGQTYLCGIVNTNGDIQHTVILGYNDKPLDHAGQLAWAHSLGGTLLNRIEGGVLWAMHRELASKGEIWLEDEWKSAFAWFQGAYIGNQNFSRKGVALRAVAVSRSVIRPFTHSPSETASDTEKVSA